MRKSIFLLTLSIGLGLSLPLIAQEAVGGKTPWTPEASSPRLTTALVASMPSSQRPFRLFLDPEMDFSPYGTYLPEWELVFPTGQMHPDAFNTPQVHYHRNQIWQHPGGQVSAWIVVEDRTKSTNNKFTYLQARIFFDPLSRKVLLDRQAFYDAGGEFIDFEVYEPRLLIEESKYKSTPWGRVIPILATYAKEHPGNTHKH